MEPLSISIEVHPDGTTQGRSWHDEAAKDGRQVDLTGVDGQLLRLFERWLADDRTWTMEEIRTFGQLLHRQLFSEKLWTWVEDRIERRDGSVVRLQLSFPVDAASSRLATLPWEFLCAPDRPGRDGRFLVQTPGLILSRSVPPGTPVRPAMHAERLRVLRVVGDAHNEWLGEIDYRPVLDEIAAHCRRSEFEVLDAAVEVTGPALADIVARTRPHLVHYIGHGRFDPATGKGAVALRTEDGDTDWIDEDHLTGLLCTDDWTPAIVVLHACEGGRNDYEYRHAGLAPGLVRRGVQCVVAMQYSVLEDTAEKFSSALYAALADGRYLDDAVQAARDAIWRDSRDARLLGVPMIYQRDATPLLGDRTAQAVRPRRRRVPRGDDLTAKEFRIAVDDSQVTGEYGAPGLQPDPVGRWTIELDPLGLASAQLLHRWLSVWDLIEGVGNPRFQSLLERGTLEVLGTHLWRLLLANDIGDELQRRIPRAGSPPLRLSIEFREKADAALRSLPWEFLYDPYKKWFLATETELLLTRYVHRPQGRTKVAQVGEKEQLRALLIAALPNVPDFAYQREVLGKLRTALTDISHLEKPKLITEWKQEEIRRTLEEKPYHIVHVVGICKGDAQGKPLIYFGKGGVNGYHEPSQFIDCLTAGRSRPRLIILQLCDYVDGDATENFELMAPALIEREVPAVLALQYAPSRAEPDHVGLGKQFYQSLVDGDSIGMAVQESRRWLRDDHIDRRFGTPVLYLQEDGALLRPLRRTEATESPARPDPPAETTVRDVLIQVCVQRLKGAALLPYIRWIEKIDASRSAEDVRNLVQVKLLGKESEEAKEIYLHMFMAVQEWMTRNGQS